MCSTDHQRSFRVCSFTVKDTVIVGKMQNSREVQFYQCPPSWPWDCCSTRPIASDSCKEKGLSKAQPAHSSGLHQINHSGVCVLQKSEDLLFSDIVHSVHTKLKSLFSCFCIAYSVTVGEVQAQTSEGSECHRQLVNLTHKSPLVLGRCEPPRQLCA